MSEKGVGKPTFVHFPKLFDNIFVPYEGKNLLDGEILCLGMISKYLYMLFYAGEIQT